MGLNHNEASNIEKYGPSGNPLTTIIYGIHGNELPPWDEAILKNVLNNMHANKSLSHALNVITTPFPSFEYPRHRTVGDRTYRLTTRVDKNRVAHDGFNNDLKDIQQKLVQDELNSPYYDDSILVQAERDTFQQKARLKSECDTTVNYANTPLVVTIHGDVPCLNSSETNTALYGYFATNNSTLIPKAKQLWTNFTTSLPEDLKNLFASNSSLMNQDPPISESAYDFEVGKGLIILHSLKEDGTIENRVVSNSNTDCSLTLEMPSGLSTNDEATIYRLFIEHVVNNWHNS